MKNLEEKDVKKGNILTTVNVLQPPIMEGVKYFSAQVKILEIDNILSVGSKMVLYVHEACEDVIINKIFDKIYY